MSAELLVSFKTRDWGDMEIETLDLLQQVMKRYQEGPHRAGDNERVAAYFYARWTEKPPTEGK